LEDGDEFWKMRACTRRKIIGYNNHLREQEESVLRMERDENLPQAKIP
jgi:hypothetical protein